MKSKTNTFQLALAGMLIAIGIVIPMFSPIKIIIEPASFTLASHVPVFIAMFISPMMAAATGRISLMEIKETSITAMVGCSGNWSAVR